MKRLVEYINRVGLRRRAWQLTEALSEIAQELNLAPDLDTALDLVLEHMERVIAFESGSIMLLEGDKMRVVAVGGFDKPELVLGAELSLNQASLNREVVETRRPLIMGRAADDPRWFAAMGNAGWSEHLGKINSWIGVPLLIRNRVIGMLTADKVEPNFYRPEDAEFAMAFASHAAIAIENARLLESERAQLRLAQTLQEVGALLTTRLSLDEVSEHIFDLLARVVAYDSVSVQLLDENERMELVAGRNLGSFVQSEQVVRALAAKTLPQRWGELRVLVIPDTHADDRWVVWSGSEYIRSWIGAALLVKDRVVGVLNVDSAQVNAYDAAMGETVAAFANQAAVAIENARLYDRSQQELVRRGRAEKEREQLLADLERRSNRLGTAAEVSTSASTILDPGLLMDRTVNLILERFHFYYAGIFLVDETGTRAFLRAGTGSAGRTMLAAGHNLLVGGDSMIGQCIAQAQARVALDVGRAAERFENPLLPETRSEMALPLVSRGECIGALTVQCREENAFSDEDVAVLQTMADQLANAIENARLYEAAQHEIRKRKKAEEEIIRLYESVERHNKELTTLYEAAKAISSDLSLDAVLETVAQQMTHALDSQGCILSLWRREQEQIEVLLDYQPNRSMELEPIRQVYDLDEYAAARQVLETRSPTVVRGEDPLVSGSRDGQSVLMIPLIARDRVLGLAELLNGNRAKSYSPEEIRLAQSLASQAAVAVENAQLYQQRRLQASKLAALLEIGHEISAISAVPDLPGLLERIAAHARDLLDADGSDVYLLESDGESLRAIVSIGEYSEEMLANPLTVGEGIVGAVAQNGVAEVVNDIAQDARAVQIPGTPVESHALMCAPLISRGSVIGVMALERTGERGGFYQADLDFLVNLARQASIAIENVRMYAAEQQRTEDLAGALSQQRDLDGLKDQFVQNVTHELRTPLSIIQGYSQLLDDEALGELLPEQHEAVSIIAKRAAGLQKLSDDLTAMLLTQTQVPKRVSVDLGELAHELLADFKLEAKNAGLRLLADIDPDLPMLQGDPEHLCRVLDNLISNAIKFTPAGGRVTVRLEPVGADLVVEVSDTGVGIPSDQLDDVFGRFYQVDGSMTRRYGGTGLGLALVQEVVEAHGGTIEVESELGQGSLFRVKLPCPV